MGTLEGRALEFDRKIKSFSYNAFKFIELMLSSRCPERYVDEILHSIFFLGHILRLEAGLTLNTEFPEFTPEGILGEMYDEVAEVFPEPFDCYRTELPKRTPFSSVLDMVLHRYGPENEWTIVTQLHSLVQNLKLMDGYKLSSSTICVSKYESSKFYGASMSTEGKIAGRIMIAASCLGTWHKHVSSAVMSYFPGKQKRNDFDGTFRLPDSVSCQAYSISNRASVPPCSSCSNLFGLTTTDPKVWVYGHCAEAESVSRLLTGKQEVAMVIGRQVEASPSYGRREHVARQTRRYLEDLRIPGERGGFLILTNFQHNGNFVYYNPQ